MMRNAPTRALLPVLLGLLLDPLGTAPRRFSNAEVAAVRRALQLTYARYDWHTELLADHSLTPTLESLCHRLRQVAEQATAGPLTAEPLPGGQVAGAAAALAEEIHSLYVGGDYAGTFNVPTNIDLTLREQLVLFDFSQVPERRRPLFYYAVLAGLNHQVRRHPRRRAIIVDEVHYMSQEASLMTFLANMVKTVLGLRDRTELAFVDDQRGKPSFTPDLADGIHTLAIRRLPGQLPQESLVVGVGAQGLLMSLALQRRGVRVVVTDVNPDRVAFATDALGVAALDPDDGRQFELVVDTTGVPEANASTTLIPKSSTPVSSRPWATSGAAVAE